MSPGEKKIVSIYAGPIGGRHLPWGRIRTAHHEAGHACGGYFLGLAIGKVSSLPGIGNLGYAMVSINPLSPARHDEILGSSRVESDSRAALRIALLEWSNAGTDVRRRLRELRNMARDLLSAYDDVHGEFALELFERGSVEQSEAEPLIEALLDGLNLRLIEALVNRDAEAVRFSHPATLSRLLAASHEIIRHRRVSLAMRSHWNLVRRMAEAEIDRRAWNARGAQWIRGLGALQIRAIARLVDQAVEVSRARFQQSVDREYSASVEISAVSIAA